MLFRSPGLSVPQGAYYWLMVTEMFNPSLGDVHRIGSPTYYENILPTVPARVRDAAVVLRNGAPLDARYVLATCRSAVEGRVVAASPHRALLLIESASPLRLSSIDRCAASLGS